MIQFNVGDVFKNIYNNIYLVIRTNKQINDQFDHVEFMILNMPSRGTFVYTFKDLDRHFNQGYFIMLLRGGHCG